ncbi:MAG: 23S rRNA (guanosine(2251)-2'-O)-methyltransferase RlmB, partial [Gammaproteobacteria bacterium AqS3]|nr:23S rRNA (guanosine(2251)-2'-O)-methyltransferase RlmB [Gammaproteobacteria bacterium AqS3]
MSRSAAGAPEHAWGIHAVRAILELRPESVLQFWAVPGGAVDELIELAARSDIHVEFTGRGAIERLARTGTGHQGALVRYRPLPEQSEAWLCETLRGDAGACALALDGVTDAHNLGACLRSADV